MHVFLMKPERSGAGERTSRDSLAIYHLMTVRILLRLIWEIEIWLMLKPVRIMSVLLMMRAIFSAGEATVVDS